MPSQSKDTPSVEIVSVDVTVNIDFLREGLRLLVQVFIELELNEVIEALPHERSSSRRSYRNGYRHRTWVTSVGELTLEIPKLRKGSYYPAFFDALRESETVLIESLRKIYKSGVTTSDVKKIVDVMGFGGTQPEQIAEIVEQVYDLVDRFRSKPQVRYLENLALYRPVNAISTRTIDTSLSDNDLPKALYMGSLSMGQMDNWLSESLDMLIRIHRAFADEVDAVAV